MEKKNVHFVTIGIGWRIITKENIFFRRRCSAETGANSRYLWVVKGWQGHERLHGHKVICVGVSQIRMEVYRIEVERVGKYTRRIYKYSYTHTFEWKGIRNNATERASRGSTNVRWSTRRLMWTRRCVKNRLTPNVGALRNSPRRTSRTGSAQPFPYHKSTP